MTVALSILLAQTAAAPDQEDPTTAELTGHLTTLPKAGLVDLVLGAAAQDWGSPRYRRWSRIAGYWPR